MGVSGGDLFLQLLQETITLHKSNFKYENWEKNSTKTKGLNNHSCYHSSPPQGEVSRLSEDRLSKSQLTAWLLKVQIS